MRDFFIRALEVVIHIFVVIMIIAVVGAAIAAMSGVGGQGGMGPMGRPMPGNGIGLGLAILIGGGIYVVLVAGFLYLGLGIYQNTRRAADALEAMARR